MTSLKLKLNKAQCHTLMQMMSVVSLDIMMDPFERMAINELMVKVYGRLQNLHLRLMCSKPGQLQPFTLTLSEGWAVSKSIHSVAADFGGYGQSLEYKINDAIMKHSFKIETYATANRLANNAR